MSRCIVSAGILALLMGGCASTTPPAANPDAQLTAAGAVLTGEEPAVSPATQPTEAPISSSEALAWKTAAYAQAIQEYLNQRTRPASTQPALREDAPASQPAPEPVAIEWIEPAATQPAAAIAQEVIEAASVVKDPPPATQPVGSLEVEADSSDSSEPESQVQAKAETEGAAPQEARRIVTTDQFEAQLAQHVRDYPRDLAGQLEYQILQWLRGQQVPQMDVIASLPAEDREILSALMDALSNFRNGVRRNDNMLLAQKARPFIELADRLRPQVALRIPTIALCQRVRGFGMYDPIETDRFMAGRVNPVIVYCEVENFASRLNDRDLWETNLTQETVVYNDRGQRVWVEKRQAFTDLSRNRRRDFCVAREVRLPASLPPGQYSLSVSISDQQANRMAEATLGIRLISSDESQPAEGGLRGSGSAPFGFRGSSEG